MPALAQPDADPDKRMHVAMRAEGEEENVHGTGSVAMRANPTRSRKWEGSAHSVLVAWASRPGLPQFEEDVKSLGRDAQATKKMRLTARQPYVSL